MQRTLGVCFCLIPLVAFGGTCYGQVPPPGTDAAERKQNPAHPATSSSQSSGPRTSPFEPPPANDTTFVVDAAGGLDTGCTFRSGGPLVFNIEVSRYLGEVNSDGTLKNVEALKGSGLISPTATLRLPAYDVDFNAAVSGVNPERDTISFNGEEIGLLTGDNDIWKLNTFTVPIEKVRFPAGRGDSDSPPGPALNEIRIDIDTANTEEQWCTSVDWATLDFKATSPIVLVHGNGSNGGFFERQGFTQELTNQNLLFDNSISLDPSSNFIVNNSLALDGLIPSIARSFGVDSIHLVMHSKGGLDARDYLVNYQPRHDNDFKVLSYTSLSTPQEGSVLADLVLAREDAATAKSIEYVGFPDFTNALLGLKRVDRGTRNLTTTFVANFNATNLPLLPTDIVFNTVSADLDLNGNVRVDSVETRGLAQEVNTLEGIAIELLPQAVDIPYQILRNTAAVTLTFRVEPYLVFFRRTVATITSIPTAAPVGNDLLVTIPSGNGDHSLAPRVTNRAIFDGAAGRNHANVGDGGVAATVVPWIIDVERTSGDLK